MSDDVLDAFDKYLLGYLPSVPDIQTDDAWYLHLLHIPDGLPETLWSFSKSGDDYEVSVVRFCESAWRAFWQAHAKNTPFPEVHRLEGKLSSYHHPLPALDTWMEEERYGLCGECLNMEWNCDQYRLLCLTSKGSRSLETINPRQNEDAPWIELIETLETLTQELPLQFKECGGNEPDQASERAV